MRRDKAILAAGLLAGAGLAAATHLIGLGWVTSLSVLLASAVLVRGGTYLYFERYLAFKTLEDFRSEKIFHECIACGACCHLRVNLGKDDAERILTYAKESGINEVVIEKSGSRLWLKRNSGRCCFLTYAGETPRCQIYPIRPVACRLYPLIPVGDRLKADPLCPGFNREKGQTFKRYLRTQDVGAYIKKVMGKI
jgi:Fe-S-cluster containining protein